MIVWTGKGILAVIVVFVSILACTALFPNDMSNYGNALGFFIGGAFSLIFGFKWNTNEEARVLVDEKTGEKIQVKNNHSLFWIKMEYWGIIFFIIGIVILFQSSIWIGLLSILVFVLLGLFLFMNVKKSYKKKKKK